MNWTTWLVPLLTGLLGALFVYIPAARRISGRIHHSEASDIWLEGRSLRQELREDVVRLRELYSSCDNELALTKAELAATQKTHREEIEALLRSQRGV